MIRPFRKIVAYVTCAAGLAATALLVMYQGLDQAEKWMSIIGVHAAVGSVIVTVAAAPAAAEASGQLPGADGPASAPRTRAARRRRRTQRHRWHRRAVAAVSAAAVLLGAYGVYQVLNRPQPVVAQAVPAHDGCPALPAAPASLRLSFDNLEAGELMSGMTLTGKAALPPDTYLFVVIRDRRPAMATGYWLLGPADVRAGTWTAPTGGVGAAGPSYPACVSLIAVTGTSHARRFQAAFRTEGKLFAPELPAGAAGIQAAVTVRFP